MLKPQTLYTAFLAVATSVEARHILQADAIPFLEIAYIVGLFIIVFGRSRYEWIWYTGFFYIGLISLGALLLMAFNAYSQTFRIIDAVFSIVIYFKCLVYLARSEANRHFGDS
jgi:hypothetical protein